LSARRKYLDIDWACAKTHSPTQEIGAAKMRKFLSTDNLPIALIGLIAIVWYCFCICAIGFNWTQALGTGLEFRQFMSLSISTLSGTLATFVGMVFGVHAIKNIQKVEVPSQLTTLQWLAAIVYVASLIVALLAWRITANVDPVIIALGKSFLGLIGGVLAVGLNVTPSTAQGGVTK
jgi:hypothetical protein